MAARLDPTRWAWPIGLVPASVAAGILAGIDPTLGVAAALGLAFVALVAVDLTLGVCAFVVLSFLTPIPGIGAPLAGFSKVAGALLVVSWLATLAVRPEVRRNLISAHSAFAYLLLLFVGWAALSVVWAEEGGVAATDATRYGLNLLLFPVVYTAIRERRHVVWFISAFVVGALVSALYGMAAPQDPLNPGRLAGAGINANDLATVLVAGLVLAAALAAVYRRSPALAAAAIVAAATCAFSTFLTLSRSGLLALGVVLVASLLVASRRRGRMVVVALLVAVSTVFYFGVVAGPAARERVTQLGSGSGRLDIWTVGWRMFESNPVLGVGAGNFRTSSVHYLFESGSLPRSDLIVDRPKQAHNIYLDVLTELGVVGLVPFLAILAFAIACSLRAAAAFRRARDGPMNTLARAVAVAQLGVLAAAFFASIQFNNQLWLLIALGPALLAIARAEGGYAAGEDARLPA